MADEGGANAEGAENKAINIDESDMPEDVKCPDCPPGLPAWLATFSDLVTLLLTFFVLLLSFAKTESAKYEAALGSVRNAFGGNVLKHGEVIQRGKSPDNFPTMMESQSPIKPFPIEFLTMEGILDKHEINRNSDEDLKKMRFDLKEHALAEDADFYEVAEGIKIRIKDKIYFKKGSVEIDKERVRVSVYSKLVKLLKEKDWKIFIIGYASRGEVSLNGKLDSFELSSARAVAVTRSLMKRGIVPNKITTAFYGDSNPVKITGLTKEENEKEERRVEFIIRKRDLNFNGHKVESK